MLLTALLGLAPLLPAARASAQAVEPFQEQSLVTRPRHPHRLAYATMLTGAAFVGTSFAVTHHADQLYDRYLAASEPGQAEKLYDDTSRWDGASTALLLSGEALVLTGVWLRFLRPAPGRLGLVITPGACAASLQF